MYSLLMDKCDPLCLTNLFMPNLTYLEVILNMMNSFLLLPRGFK